MLHSEGLEKWQGHRVLAIFGAFRLLFGGVNCAKHKRHVAPKFTCEFGRNSKVYCFVASGIKQLPLAKYEIYLTFSKSIGIQKLKSFITKL